MACTPASGWEKGQVENPVGYARDNLFKPRLKFRTLEELNGWLEAECARRAETDRHPEYRDQDGRRGDIFASRPMLAEPERTREA